MSSADTALCLADPTRLGSLVFTRLIQPHRFALVFVVFAATDAERAVSTAPLPILAPLSIGMIVFACHLVAIPIDGCSINPARSFGPALVAERWHNFWIFWVGPYTGALIASVMYELLFRTRGMVSFQMLRFDTPVNVLQLELS